MSGAPTDAFAHGTTFGDIAGVVFSAIPHDGVTPVERLVVSDRFISALFHGLLTRASRTNASTAVPRLVQAWNQDAGWTAMSEPIAITAGEARALADALAMIEPLDVAAHCAGCTVDEALRCARAIHRFYDERLTDEFDLFIERD